jgi:hypothetical protein
VQKGKSAWGKGAGRVRSSLPSTFLQKRGRYARQPARMGAKKGTDEEDEEEAV